MASVDVEIGSRRYTVACRDGEQEHLRSMAAMVDEKAQQAATALGSLSEARQLLFASLLLADALKESQNGTAPAPAAPRAEAPQADPAIADALERLASRIEMLADNLEQAPRNA